MRLRVFPLLPATTALVVLCACSSNTAKSKPAATRAVSVASPAASSTDDPRVAALQATIAALQAKLAVTPTPETIVRTVTVVVTPPPTPSPTPSPSPTPPPAKLVGNTTVAVGRGGVQLALTVNAIKDPAISTNQFNQPNGRWVSVDWSIVNQGSTTQDINPLDFKLQTADGFVIEEGNSAGLPEPRLSLGTLAPGQTQRGYVAYDVPLGAKVQRLFYQPFGSPQIVVVDLSGQ